VDIDTSLYYFDGLKIVHCPADSDILCYGQGVSVATEPNNVRFAFVKTDHQEISLDADQELHRLWNGFKLKDGKILDDVPDTVIIRLKNLIALDANGNDLHIGATTLKVPKYLVTATDYPEKEALQIFPNPVHDLLHLTINKAEKVAIVNTLGQTIREMMVDEVKNSIQVDDLQSGLYFIQLKESGQTIRFVKQ
jgi:hypothetical protein